MNDYAQNNNDNIVNIAQQYKSPQLQTFKGRVYPIYNNISFIG
jgi:hypothetical protein